MSCGCDSGSSYDGGYGNGYNGLCNADTPYPSVSSESVPSLINNLTYALYGQIQKNVTNGQVTWTIPCDPNNTATINGIPRVAGEGLLCYVIRSLNLTIPSNGFVTVNGVQTLTNKTLDATCVFLGNAITATTATEATNISGGLAGSIPYQSGVGLTELLPQGTAGQVLSTNGSGSIGWITNSTTSSSANNINGGTAGVAVYQTGVNTTGFTAVGTSGQVLLSNGTSAPTWSSDIAGNSGTATQLQTSRTIGISGDVTGVSAFNGSANATIGATIAGGAITYAKLGANEQKQICKAWVNFDGGTGVIRSSYNVNSVTRSGAGTYTVNFTTAMTDVNYSISCSKYVTNVLYGSQLSVQSLTANNFAIVSTENRAVTDSAIISAQIFGN